MEWLLLPVTVGWLGVHCGCVPSQDQANLREASLDLLGGRVRRGVGGLPVLPQVFCFLGVSLSLVFASPSRLLCGKAHPGSARGAPAMAAADADADLDQMIPVKKVRGSILHNFSMAVREALKVDQCILCNSCWLCRGCEVTRLLPYGWHKDYCAARTQLCTSVLSRISGLCNDCIRMGAFPLIRLA